MVGTGRGAQLGLLIKGPEVLESTRRVDTIVLDKTGTVTTGKMSLTEVTVADGIDAAEALRLVGALEHASEHPIAQAIATAAAADGPLPAVEGFANREGLGVEGVVDGHALIVGRPALLADWAMHLPPELDAARRAAEARGPDRDRRRLGRPRGRDLRRRRHRQAHLGGSHRPRSRRSGSARSC